MNNVIITICALKLVAFGETPALVCADPGVPLIHVQHAEEVYDEASFDTESYLEFLDDDAPTEIRIDHNE